MKRAKIYLRAGVGFLVLFIITVYALTEIQTRHINNNMQGSYNSASIKLINDINRAAESPFTDDWRLSDLMFSVNDSICGVGQQWSNMNMYSSVLLLDSNRDVIYRSGNSLQVGPSYDVENGRNDNFIISLDQYCTNEQINQIFAMLYNHNKGTGVFVKGDISGYFNKWGFVPQRISLGYQEESVNKLILEFDNFSSENIKTESWQNQNAILWVQGMGSKNRALTDKDRIIVKECEAAGLTELSRLSPDSNGTGTGGSKLAQFKYSEAVPVKIDGETCYLVMGVQGFPQRDAILSLIPIYIFLLVLMVILFFVVSHSFIKIYKQQIELETTRQDLISAVAHELKTPLSVIRNFSESLKEKINEEKKEHYLDVILDESERMNVMVSDMLALSQLESGVKLTLQNHSLNHIAEQILARYHEPIANKGVIAAIVSSGNCVVSCDAKLIEQVISNFLSNAIQYTPENGHIVVEINNKDGQTVFTIENSGQHIPADRISRIWDAFYKADPARSNPKGTGLGLSIVKNILIAHGFEFGAENTESGVKFWFTVKIRENSFLIAK